MSLASISVHFRSFLKQKTLKQELFPGTHKNYYFLSDYQFNFEISYQNLIDGGNVTIDKLHSFLKLTKGHNQDISTKFIVPRIQELIHFFQRRNEMLRFEQVENDLHNVSQVPSYKLTDNHFPLDSKLNTKTLDTLIALQSEQMGDLQKLVKNFFTPEFFYIQDSTSAAIYSTFLLFDFLTQDLIADLTGFSISTVSRSLRKLIEEQYLKESQFKFQGKKVYQMEPLELPTKSYKVLYTTVLESYSKRFLKMKHELMDREGKRMGYPGFTYIITFIERLLTEFERMGINVSGHEKTAELG